jgi:hypothetical protein
MIGKVPSKGVGGLRRMAAVLMLPVVLLLAFSAVSPELHGWIHSWGVSATADHPQATCPHHSHHGEELPTTDDGCVIDLFAHGQVLLTSDVPIDFHASSEVKSERPAVDRLLAPVAGLLPPACGPPASPV